MREHTAPRKRFFRITRIVVLVLLIIIASLAGLWFFARAQAAHKRAEWKNSALRRLSALSVTNEEIREELAQLTPFPAANNGSGWTGDHVLLMKNGESIIFAFRHGANDGFVDHLFLGHGSNGKWLYSTFHFCNSMNMVSNDDPPESITDFEKRYAAREFDGVSDKCLEHTWPSK